jgi:hypothetical protein
VVLFKSVPRARIWLVLAATLIPSLVLNTAFAAQQQPTRKRPAKAAKKAASEPLAAPVPPPPPPTPEQMPAVQPQVHYSQGQLTIVAENSTLADILRAVRAQTGAAIEVPPNATERVVTHLGPGPARDILATLLNGSHFNYVMLGSAAHPDSVDRVILTSKSGGVPEPAPPPAATPVAEGNDEGQTDDVAPPGMDMAEQPVDNPAGDSGNDENQAQPQDGQQQVKTPEELLRELQKQQLLQQQQLQQQQQRQQGQQQAPPPNENQ